jgi:signal peptide peptidase SppA
MNRIPRLLAAFYQSPWAMLEEKLVEMEAAVRAGQVPELTSEQLLAHARVVAELEEQARAVASRGPRSAGTVAVLTVRGLIGPRYDAEIAYFGGTPLDLLAGRFRVAVADPDVKAIVLDIDSPGGSVIGLQEMADEIFAARAQKKIYASVNHMAASAAYWLASQADDVRLSPSGLVGSIGVFSLHMDMSKALEDLGVKPTLLTTARYKAEAHPYFPLSDEARDFALSQMQEYHESFVKAVARGRGVALKVVREQFGEGRMFVAGAAKQRGMVDGIRTYDQVLASLGVGAAPVEHQLKAERAMGDPQGQECAEDCPAPPPHKKAAAAAPPVAPAAPPAQDDSAAAVCAQISIDRDRLL